VVHYGLLDLLEMNRQDFGLVLVVWKRVVALPANGWREVRRLWTSHARQTYASVAFSKFSLLGGTWRPGMVIGQKTAVAMVRGSASGRILTKVVRRKDEYAG
jgi:hypothetical protein